MVVTRNGQHTTSGTGAGKHPLIPTGKRRQQVLHIRRQWDGPFAFDLVTDGSVSLRIDIVPAHNPENRAKLPKLEGQFSRGGVVVALQHL